MGDEESDTSAIHDEPTATMGRRRFVNTLASLGFGAASTAMLAPEDVAAAGRDEVPIVYGITREDGDLRPRRTVVPVDWYDDFRNALAAHRNLDVFGHEAVASSAVSPGEFGGPNAHIDVAVTSEEARGAVPESVDRVPVEVRRVGSAERPEDRDFEDPPPPSVGERIPGSVAIASEELYGTLAPAMGHPTDGSRFFATANHVFDGSDTTGEPLYLADGDRTKIGTVRAGYPKADLACARPDAGFVPVHRIREGRPGRVLGQFTKAGLASLKAADEPLEKVGIRTGRTTGKIQAVDGFTCAYGAICKRGQLKWGRESGFADGDSGSVNYHPDPDDPDSGVLVAGFNNARTWWPGENYIWGTAAYHITEKHGYTF